MLRPLASWAQCLLARLALDGSWEPGRIGPNWPNSPLNHRGRLGSVPSGPLDLTMSGKPGYGQVPLGFSPRHGDNTLLRGSPISHPGGILSYAQEPE